VTEVEAPGDFLECTIAFRVVDMVHPKVPGVRFPAIAGGEGVDAQNDGTVLFQLAPTNRRWNLLSSSFKLVKSDLVLETSHWLGYI
jgi:hypothetical protein